MAMHNFDGSRPSQGVTDNATLPLMAEPAQPLLSPSMLLNPGTDSQDDRPPAAIPMYPFGFDAGDADPLFSLEPRRKG